MTLADYMNGIVVPTLRRPWSRHHTYLACIAVFHVKDYLKKGA
jgi:hypothetical protein